MKYITIVGLMFVLGMWGSQLFAATDKFDDNEVRTYNVSDFNRIHIEGGYSIILEQSDKTGLRIRADEKAFRYIDVDSSDETLRLRITQKKFDFNKLELYIKFKDLSDLHIKGGASLKTQGYLDLEDLNIHIEGGAKIKMELKADKLDVLGEGGVSFNFKGVANRVHAHICGAGHLDADELRAKYVVFEIEGVGAGSVYATETLKAMIKGVGKIKYSGEPEVQKQIDGIGFVNKE